jgi:Protein kinase domain
MTYSLNIELFLQKEESPFSVFQKDNLRTEDCIKESLKWRLRPFQKSIKYIQICIFPDIEYDSETHMTIMSTSSTMSNSEGTQKDDNIIKKKINFAFYGKFLHFLKTFCFKNDYGKFKIQIHLDDFIESSYKGFLNKVSIYEEKIKRKLLQNIKKENNVVNIAEYEYSVGENKKMCKSIIGLGAFGVVFKTDDIKDLVQSRISSTSKDLTDNTYSVKIIPLQTITNVSSVYRELHMLQVMSTHKELEPYVVKYFYSTIDTHYLYIVMEYLPGPSLTEYIIEKDYKSLQTDKERNANCNDIFKITKHLTKGVRNIHSFGICHRDIKPGNIILDANNNFKIVDFGFSALIPNIDASDTLKCDNKVVGTYRFSSPEVLSFSSDIDWQKSDLWSLGTSLYFVVTGKHFLERTSKDRNAMLNILHKRMEGTKPLYINLYTEIFSTSNSTYLSNNVQRKLKKYIRGLLEYTPENRKI